VIQAAGALTAVAILPDLSYAARRAPVSADGPLTVGLIGAGRQGRLILGELARLEGVKVVAVCDTEAPRREAGAKRGGEGVQAFADHKEMLGKLGAGLGAVVIATPTHLHKEPALDALSAGKHVYCEAPLAHTVEDCRAIAAAAAANPKAIFAVGLEGRANPIYRFARTFFLSDAVRDFVGAEAQHAQKNSWRAGGGGKAADWRLDPEVSLGLAGELGVHQLDVIHWYTGKLPVTVSGSGSVRGWDDGRTLADTVHCSLGFADGSRTAYTATLANSFGGRHEVLRGTNSAIKLAWTHGWLFKEADAPTQGWEVYANRQQFFSDEGITLIADATKLASQGKLQEGVGLPSTSLHYALSDFVKAAAEGKPPACDAAAGAKSTIVSIMAAKAVAGNTTLAIDPESLKL
jgi:predicted dehydrogenase